MILLYWYAARGCAGGKAAVVLLCAQEPDTEPLVARYQTLAHINLNCAASLFLRWTYTFKLHFCILYHCVHKNASILTQKVQFSSRLNKNPPFRQQAPAMRAAKPAPRTPFFRLRPKPAGRYIHYNIANPARRIPQKPAAPHLAGHITRSVRNGYHCKRRLLSQFHLPMRQIHAFANSLLPISFHKRYVL